MNKLYRIFVAAMICLVVFSIAAYAITSLSWNQNPQVPDGSFIVYRSDGTTAIPEGSNQTSIWTWNATAKGFDATIIIDNISPSTANINVIVDISNLAVGWTSQGFGVKTAITYTELRQVKLSITNPSAVSGSYVGSFTITVNLS
jgi:hypothetical protein